jgi:hypothetical protein
MICRLAYPKRNVIPAKAETHATIVVQSEPCMGARLRGHDEP